MIFSYIIVINSEQNYIIATIGGPIEGSQCIWLAWFERIGSGSARCCMLKSE